MNITNTDIKNDVFGTAFKIGMKTWGKTLIVNVITFCIYLAIFLPVIFVLFGINFDSFMELQSLQNDPIALKEYGEDLIREIGSISATLILGSVVLFLFLILITSWVYTIQIIITENFIKGYDKAIGVMLSESFDGKVFKVFIAQLIIGFLFVLVYAVLIGLFFVSKGLGVFTGLVGLFFIVSSFTRLLLTMPAIVLGGMEPLDAIKESFNAISLGKSVKYMLIGFGVSLGYGIVVAIIQGGFGFISSDSVMLNMSLNQLVSLIGGALFSAVFVSIITILYYRATDTLKDDQMEGDNLEEHLILD